MEQIREQYKLTVAQHVGLPVEFLQQHWFGDYSPEKHFFKYDQDGVFECRWIHDIDLLEKLTTGYIFWHSIPNGLKAQFWKSMFALYLHTPEFSNAPMPFRVWLFFKRFPIPPYNLLSILSEMGLRREIC